MDNSKFVIGIWCSIGICIGFILLLLNVFQVSLKMDKLDKCINLADTAHLDPNDDKITFINSCLK